MAYQGKSKKHKKKKNSGTTILLVILILLTVVAAGVLGFLVIQLMKTPESPSPVPVITEVQSTTVSEPDTTETTETTEPETTEPPTTEPPEPEHVVATATIGSTGDILMHKPVFQAGLENGGYDLNFIFKYLKEYSESVDFAVANLETTLAGTSLPYAGFPMFNCPDEIVDAARDAGFDMLLTANNHCFDTRQAGYNRTIETVREKGLQTLGTYLDENEPKYTVQDINGIKIGMMCYTYQTPIPENGYRGRVYLNGLAMDPGGENIITSFLPSNPDPFYEEVAQFMTEMKEQGAEATVIYLHWGEEYVFNPIPYQKTMAQKLCDMGIDVIIGGHPHVVEPMELLTSNEDPEHKTVCLYSMGNAVSNQRLGNLSSVSTAHTEDGVWFTITFSKYSDDTVYLESVDLIPTWVDLRTSGHREYDIIPLEDARRDEWQSAFEMNDTATAAAGRSYDRTMALVGEGLTACQEYLAAQKDLREANYLAAVVEMMEG